MLSATNLKKVNAITTREGESTCYPPYPAKTGKVPAVQEEKEAQHDFHDTNFLPFPHKYRRPTMDE